MPKSKSTPIKAKPYAKSTTKPRPRKPKHSSLSSETATSPAIDVKGNKKTKPHTTPEMSKDLILKIILAKLESAKTCDWHELSLKLASDGDVGKNKKGVKAKKGIEETGYSGTELYDIYNNSILPGLKSGSAIWKESPTPSPVEKSSNLGSHSPIGSLLGVNAIIKDEGVDEDDEIDEEDELDEDDEVDEDQELVKTFNQAKKQEMKATGAGRAVKIAVKAESEEDEVDVDDVDEDDVDEDDYKFGGSRCMRAPRWLDGVEDAESQKKLWPKWRKAENARSAKDGDWKDEGDDEDESD